MRKNLKPYLNLETIHNELLTKIVNEYEITDSINKTAKNLGLSNMKVRKALITAGVYSNETSENVEYYFERGKSIGAIADILSITTSAVYGYIPYKTTAYYLKDRSVDADRSARYRDRVKTLKELKRVVDNSPNEWASVLWRCLILYQGQKFRTLGRGLSEAGAVTFTYKLKVSSKTGELTDELIFSTREKGKTITKSSVERAFEKAIAIQSEYGFVPGPKKLGTFGASYLYAIFLKWGIIKKCSSN